MTAATPDSAKGAAEHERVSGYAWFVLAVLCIVYIFNFLDRQLLATLGKFIADDLHLTDAQLGNLGGWIFALFYTLIGIPVGWLADRTNRVRVLALGCFLWSLATSGCGMSNSYLQLAMSRMAVGVGEAGGAPPSYSIISDYFPAHRRGTALALFSLGVPLGQAAGTAFGVEVAHTFGWRAAFITLGVAGVVMAAVLIFLVREPKRGAKEVKLDVSMEEAPATERTKFIPTLVQFFSRPALLLTALSCGSSAFVAYGILNFTTVLLLREKHITPPELALWYALILAFIGSAGVWASGALVDKYSKRGREWYAIVPGIAMLVVIPFYVGFVYAPGWRLALLFLTVPVFLNTFYLAPALAVVQNSVRPSERTMSGAILLLVLNLIGLGLGPTYVGQMSTHVFEPMIGKEHALQYAMYSLAPFYLVAVLCHVLQARALKKEKGRTF